MSTPPDHYKTLGIPRNSDKEAVTQTYRKLAMKYHPDKNPGDEEATRKFKEVTEAFEALTKGEPEKTIDISGGGWTVKRVPVRKRPRASISHGWLWRTLTWQFVGRAFILFAILFSFSLPYLPGLLFPNMPSVRLGVSYDGRSSSCKPAITDDELAHLKEFRYLETVDLRSCYNITDDGLAYLRESPGLKVVELEGCNKITDAGLVHLAALPVLRELNLKLCSQITDAGLVSLAEMPQLRILNLRNCEKVTALGIQDLKKALPECAVLFH